MEKDFAIAFIGNNIFYHLGVVKAIEEYNMYNKFKEVSGIGLGSLSAIMFGKKDCNSFKYICTLMSNIKRIHIKEDEIYQILNMHTINKSLNEKIHIWSRKISKEGMINWSDILKIINNKYTNLGNNDFKMDCYLGCYELPFMRKSVFKLNNHDSNYMEKIILNSVAKPNIFNNIVKSKSFITGDINCELPIEILKDNNYKNILIIDSNNMKIKYEYEGLEKFNEKDLGNKIKYDEPEKYIQKAYEDTINIIKNNLKNIA
ncbi:hypothetical protein [Clostridium sporogenes]|uniref:hypothetical protein n=1 Tax=Clostridium sporogenes TaxID=1509 RepID=UPI0013D0EB65|nr:hypothetical protein [Clostridium sporogenes]NFF68593.1 hypothetical protein [Clostridium sporogenes]